MSRRLMKATLIAVALACAAQDANAACNGSCNSNQPRRSVADYLFGGYGPGPFGHGDVTYAGAYSRTCFSAQGNR